jgi:hypothetical protein
MAGQAAVAAMRTIGPVACGWRGQRLAVGADQLVMAVVVRHS